MVLRKEMETWEEENKKQAELERLFDELFGDIDTSEKSESKEAESGTEQKQSVSELDVADTECDSSDIDDEDNIVVLKDESGNDVRFEFIDLIKYENEKYVVLLPVYDSEEMDKNEVIILKLESADDVEKESYVSVDDEGTLQAVFSIFKEKFKDEFDFTDD